MTSFFSTEDRLKKFLLMLAIFALGSGILGAAPLFTQCPPTGLNTGCQFLITIGPGGTVSIAMDPLFPNNGPYDGDDDTLVGVFNNSSLTITSIPLSSTANQDGGIFAFDGDGPCTQTPHPAGCPPNNAFPGDTSSNGFPGDPTGYGGPGVTFSGIAANHRSGIVNFNPGITPGGSAWFGLEEALTLAGDITPGPPNGVPEPTSLICVMSGIGLLGLVRWRRRHT
jgi:hypothetical protein